MHLVVNGTERTDLEDGATVSQLLAVLGLGARWVLVERNGEPVDRSTFAEAVLVDGDRIELVRAVAGG